MKAVVYRKKEGLLVEDVAKPEPGAGEVVLKIANTGFCSSDQIRIESGELPDGLILGHETSGVVAEVGGKVTGLQPGMRAIVRPTFCGHCRSCRLGRPYLCQNGRHTIGIGDMPGAFAEYIKVHPSMIIPIPNGVSSRNAALAESFASALHGIRCAGSTGGAALVRGGGPIGLATIQLLKLRNFGPIVLSEPVAEKRELGRRFGADRAVDPFSEDLPGITQEQTKKEGFATVLECSGAPGNAQLALDLAAQGGSVCIVSRIVKPIAIDRPMTINLKECKLTGSISNTHEENIRCLQWMADGRIDGLPLISDLVSLDQLPAVYRERIRPGKIVKAMVRIGDEF